MAASWVLLRTTWRSSARGLLGLALLMGLAGGAVLTGAESARRTDSAFDRLVADTAAWDVLVNPDAGTASDLRIEDVAGLAGVESVARIEGVLLGPRTIESVRELDEGPSVFAGDGHWGYQVARPLVRQGRVPDPTDPEEIFVSELAATELGLEIGDRYAGRVLTASDFGALESAADETELVETFNAPATGRTVDLTVVGIGAYFDEIVVDEGFGDGSVMVTPAFFDTYGRPSAGYWGALVVLQEGVDQSRFRAEVEALVPEESVAFQSRDAVAAQFARAADPQVAALVVFSVVAVVVGLVIVGQAISRRLQVDAAALAPLAAVGVTSTQRAALGILRVGLAAAAGAVLAVGVAIVASPIAPVGVAREAEPDLGVRLDGPVLVLGALAVIVAFTLVAVQPAISAARRPRPAPVRPDAASRAASSGLPPAAASGLRFALGRGPAGVPARATLAGAVTSVGLIAATVTFSANLNHFTSSSTLYGTPWSVVLDVEGVDERGPRDFRQVAAGLVRHEEVTSFAVVHPGQLRLDGQSRPAVAIESSERPVVPTMLDGRPPTGPGEVALGAVTRDDLDLEVGDTVTVGRQDRTALLTVVGTAVLPAVGAYSGADKTTLGEGVLTTPEVLAERGPEFAPYGVVVEGEGLDARRLGADARLAPPRFVVSAPPTVPSDVTSLERVRATPLVLTGLLAALIALTVVHALAVAVRYRRRELAVLRTLGFTRRQVFGAIGLQAGLIAGVGLALGVPIGVGVGRVAWAALADRLGALVELVTPVLVLGALAVGVVVLALLVGLVPGGRAATARPADILRTE